MKPPPLGAGLRAREAAAGEIQQQIGTKPGAGKSDGKSECSSRAGRPAGEVYICITCARAVSSGAGGTSYEQGDFRVGPKGKAAAHRSPVLTGKSQIKRENKQLQKRPKGCYLALFIRFLKTHVKSVGFNEGAYIMKL